MMMTMVMMMMMMMMIMLSSAGPRKPKLLRGTQNQSALALNTCTG